MTGVARLIRGIALALLATAIVVSPAAAQTLGWSGSAEGSGSIFFGNTSQWLIAAHTNGTHVDSSLEVHGEARAGYAKTKTDSGTSVLSSRSWMASLGLDYHPFDRLSPFFSGSIESSFEQRIHRRYSAGLGTKLIIAHDSVTNFDLSLAVLGERTEASDPSIELGVPASRVRYSWRVRAERRLAERIKVSHSTLYQPSASEMSTFTLNSSTSLGIDLNSTLTLTFTAEDNYDSEARSRGARNNNNGRLLLGLRASY